MTAPRRPPLTESRKVLAAARPPEGTGPTTAAVLRGLARVRPPLPVLLATALLALVPLALLAVAGWCAVGIAGGDWPLLGKLAGGTLLCGVLVLLAALAHRGTKRVLHLGSYAEGFFPARLLTIACVVTGLFLAKYVLLDGEPTDPTMVLPFVALAVAWAPWPLLLLPSAQAWPRRVALRWSRAARDADEAVLVALLAPHPCPGGVPPWPWAVDPLVAETGPGWRVHGPCPRCGAPVDVPVRAADVPAEGLGGGDLHALRTRLAPAPGEGPDLPARLDDGSLLLLRARSATGVDVQDRLFALVPDGADAVPGRRRTGTPVPLLTPESEFGRPVLQERREQHAALLAAADAELARRGR
ncbi:hypothetical protein [Klenkia brasiliensis]|uniref:Uncharacterized protein n=1 Tax=Klenkia brasiliensis TaxID=333142 RepID=A0A1G7QIF2_9ACTN|nr:hypothetical protein [Klenkia brasiliensis]SDF98256.1 hypothetical protein SAMN05660324_1495 [Klenkia brasiliensis]